MRWASVQSSPRQADRRGFGRLVAEQAALPAGPLVGGAGGVGEDRLGGGEHRGPLGLDAVERAGAGEAFELAAVEQPRIDPRGEILEAGERPVAVALLDQRSIAFSPTPLSAPSA